MCLAVPGQILSLLQPATPAPEASAAGAQTAPPPTSEETQAGENLLMAAVSFGGIVKEICLALVPDAKPGDYVIVHAGFALRTLDEPQARAALEAIDALAAIEPDPPASAGPANPNHAFPR